MLGLVFESAFFPRTLTQTSTQVATSVTTLTITGKSSATGPYPVVTATVIFVLVDGVVATCTTISGTRSIVYAYLVNGETTKITTIYPPHLPQEYQVTLITDTTVSASNETYVSQPDTC